MKKHKNNLDTAIEEYMRDYVYNIYYFIKNQIEFTKEDIRKYVVQSIKRK